MSFSSRPNDLLGELITIILAPRASWAVGQWHACAVLALELWALGLHSVVEPHQVALVLSFLAMMGAILSRSIVRSQHKTASIVEAERGAARIRVKVGNMSRRHVLVVAFVAHERLRVIKVVTFLLLNFAVLLTVFLILWILIILTWIIGSPLSTPFATPFATSFSTLTLTAAA